MQFLAWVLQISVPSRGGICGGKITSMQGMHIFQRDRTTQLIKCTPWNTRLYPHPTLIKKMKTFLVVEGKMGPIPQPASSQYRPPQLDTNPYVRKRKERGQCPLKGSGLVQPPSAVIQLHACLQLFSKAPVNVTPQTDASENRPPSSENAPVHESTPWPGAGKMSGNLFEERNW